MNLGVKFRSDVNGMVSGIRFYKGAGNNGTHTGSLYSAGGTLLAQATFSGETASGWQQVSFSPPVNITANTTYVASLFTTSGFAYDLGYFTGRGADNAPLRALAAGVDGGNGVYVYSAGPQFPSAPYADTNFWVDVTFTTSGGVCAAYARLSGGYRAGRGGLQFRSGGNWRHESVHVFPHIRIAPHGVESQSLVGDHHRHAQRLRDFLIWLEGNRFGERFSHQQLLYQCLARGIVRHFHLEHSVTPSIPFASTSPVNVGVKFRSDVGGMVSGIRFYKGAGNNGTHIGSLYSAGGTLLAQATFSGETASGWQQVSFSPPVSITANTTYVASLFTTTGFAYDLGYFTGRGVDNAPLHALASGVDGTN